MLSCIPRQSRGMHIAIMNGLLQRYDLSDLCAIDQVERALFLLDGSKIPLDDVAGIGSDYFQGRE